MKTAMFRPRDATRGRKQYRYHPRWREVRDQSKFDHILTFARALPAIRSRVQSDLERSGIPREKVIAAVVRLMERTLARVGNVEYERENGSFGLTTLKNHHVRIRNGRIELDFRAKHGIRHHSVVSDRKLARILKNCRDMPGSELFQYADENGRIVKIDSGDVNDYLREISGLDITAKDFRTWAATNLAAIALERSAKGKPTKKATVEAIKIVAQQLGNTPAVCRKCYIHPAVIEAYLEGALRLKVEVPDLDELAQNMWAIERPVLRFLQSRLSFKSSPPMLKSALSKSIKAVRSARAGSHLKRARPARQRV